MNSVLYDLRYALRTAARKPGFTAVIVITLTIGIGINALIFSVVNALVIRPLPFDEPGHLVMVFENNLQENIREFAVSGPNFLDWRQQNQAFEDLAAMTTTRFNLTTAGDPVLISAFSVSPSFFQVLRVRPTLGRAFLSDEDQPGKNRVVMLSHGLWRREFGGREDILGQGVRLDGLTHTVIGVLPPNLGFLDGFGEAFVPLPLNEIQQFRGKHFLQVLARLKPGISTARAESEMKAIAQRLEQAYPGDNKGWSVELMAVQDQLQGLLRPAMVVLQGAVGFVLLIGCCNVASLLLARASGRTREVAIRTALGASRWQLLRQSMTETLLLALAGGVLGACLASWGTRLVSAMPALQSGSFRLWNPLQVDGRVLLFALAASILTAAVCGLLPAFRGSKADLNGELKEASRMSLSRTNRHWWLKILIISETALAMILLIGTGLMLKTLVQLNKVDMGFDPRNVVTATLNLPESQYTNALSHIVVLEELQHRLRSLPGVLHVGLTDVLPLGGDGSMFGFGIEGRPPGKGDNAQYRRVSTEYFDAMGMPLLSGRAFTDADRKGAASVVIINQTMARRFWPTDSPVGGHLRIAGGAPCEIVGVVKDERYRSLGSDLEPIMYVPYQQGAWWLGKLHPFTVAVRTHANPQAIVPAMRSELRAIDSDLPLAKVRTMDQLVAQSTLLSRLSTRFLAGFAGLALALCMLGIYGTLSYTVSQTTRDIGVRIALGAQSKDVVRMVTRQGLGLILAGLALGLAGGLALTRALSSLLFGVSATDPGTFFVASLLLCLAALFACVLPAHRAAQIDPVLALRYE